MLPGNNLCYYNSSSSLQKLEFCIQREHKNKNAWSKVDETSPDLEQDGFHILVLRTTNVYPVAILVLLNTEKMCHIKSIDTQHFQ